jgi:hypothetical protein
MRRFLSLLAGAVLAASLLACASRSGDVVALPANPAEFEAWDCERLSDEIDRIQRRAADVAYAVDERAGNNVLALGLGITVFWPALLAMRPDGLDAVELARLKGRDGALRLAQAAHRCPPPSPDLTPAMAATLPLALGEHLRYESRGSGRGSVQSWTLSVTALRRSDFEYVLDGVPGGPWRHDRSGNVVAAPDGELSWPHLLPGDLELGAIAGGEIGVAGDPLARARLRGLVVAVGPQTVAGRRFEAAVVELSGDAPDGEARTRVEGVIVVDRRHGVLLRLELRSANPSFTIQRRLLQVEAAPG